MSYYKLTATCERCGKTGVCDVPVSPFDTVSLIPPKGFCKVKTRNHSVSLLCISCAAAFDDAVKLAEDIKKEILSEFWESKPNGEYVPAERTVE